MARFRAVVTIQPAGLGGMPSDGQRRFRTFDLRDDDCAIERDHGARRDRLELIVQLENLAPIGIRRSCGVAVDGVDRRLDLIGTGMVAT